MNSTFVPMYRAEALVKVTFTGCFALWQGFMTQRGDTRVELVLDAVNHRDTRHAE
jgi:hypothetical protein